MKLFVGSFVVFFLSFLVQVVDCIFIQLEIVFQFGLLNMFGGEDEYVCVMFSNEDFNDDNFDVFFELLVYLVDCDSGNDCCIEDGGIWLCGGVFLSQDGWCVLMYEFSGFSVELVFYDSVICKVVYCEDIFGQCWVVDKDGLCLGQKCLGEFVDSCVKVVKCLFVLFCQIVKK